jgi:flagellar basal-body rod protein FlgB
MAKIDNMMDLLQVGIKAEELRQKTIAGNVANLETPGYLRLDVRFEELLAEAIDHGKTPDPADIEPQLYQPQNTPIKSNGNDVSWENEVGEMVKNSLKHRTYLRLFQKRLSQIDLAINIRTS